MNLRQRAITDQLIAARRERAGRRRERRDKLAAVSFAEAQAGLQSVEDHWKRLRAFDKAAWANL